MKEDKRRGTKEQGWTGEKIGAKPKCSLGYCVRSPVKSRDVWGIFFKVFSGLIISPLKKASKLEVVEYIYTYSYIHIFFYVFTREGCVQLLEVNINVCTEQLITWVWCKLIQCAKTHI